MYPVNRLRLVLLAFAILGTGRSAFADTAFTYQGVLKLNGVGVNGTADFIFRVYDAVSGGAQVGTTQNLNGVAVSSGAFSARVDCGAVFTGAPRWLDIQVRSPAGSGAYTSLTPRQELTAAPYAQFAAAPWNLDGTALTYTGGNVGVGTSTPGMLFDVAGDAHVYGTFYAGPAELGNSAAVGSTPFIDFHYGTGNPDDFNVRLINDANKRLLMAGDLRIEAADQGRPALDVTGADLAIDLDRGIINNTNSRFLYDGKWPGYYSLGWWHDSWFADPTLWLSGYGGMKFFTGSSMTPATSRVVITAGGNVGIGTEAPTNPLQIASTSGLRIGNGPNEGGFLHGYGGSSGGELSFSANRNPVDDVFLNPNAPFWFMRLAPNSDDFEIARQNRPADPFKVLFRITGNGNVGIGTEAPSAPLDINVPSIGNTVGSTAPLWTATFHPNNWQFLELFGYREDVGGWADLPLYLRRKVDDSPQGFIKFDDYDVALGSNLTETLRVTGNNRVGIGTKTPSALFEVNGGYDNYIRTNGNGLEFGGGPDSRFGFVNLGDITGATTIVGNNREQFVVTNTGTVIVDPHNGNSGTLSEFSLLFGGANGGEGIASRRTEGTNRFGLDFYTNYAQRMTITQAGNVGIGTITPGSVLDILTPTSNVAVNNPVPAVVTGTNNGGAIYFGPNAGSGSATEPTAAIEASWGGGTFPQLGIGVTRDGLKANMLMGFDGVTQFRNGTATTLYIGPTGRLGVGTTATSAQLTVRGNVDILSASTGATVLQLGEGLDYAEGFDVSEKTGEVGPGTVLVIDADNPGQLMRSTTAYDTRVAGIVAGANKLGSGVRLGVGQFDKDVALAGRVYCNVDASFGAIQPGDLLTTSPTPGYAMKATDRDRAQGAILGKAMEGLKDGRGQVLVLVSLQ